MLPNGALPPELLTHSGSPRIRHEWLLFQPAFPTGDAGFLPTSALAIDLLADPRYR